MNKAMGKALKHLVCDYLMIYLTGCVSCYLANGNVFPRAFFYCAVISATHCALMVVLNVYRLREKDSSMRIVRQVVISMSLSDIIWYIACCIRYGALTVQTRWILVYDAFALLGVCALRYARRSVNDRTRDSYGKPKALIFGAGEIGSLMARTAEKGIFDYDIAGFIDDAPELKNSIVVRYPVLGTSDDLPGILDGFKEDVTVIIAISQISPEKIQNTVRVCKEHGAKIKIVQAIFTPNNSEVNIRDINYADLLGRRLVTIDREPIQRMLEGKTVLVTGAGGSIGSEICTQLKEYGLKKLILLDIDETELHDLSLRLHDYMNEWSDSIVPVVCDIRNAKKLGEIIKEHRPEIVFHAAAYKHVPLMELYPDEALKTNINGSANLFRSCVANGVDKVVVISTDKAVNPTNVMGATKRTVELMAGCYNESGRTEFCCVRFGNVIGSRGSMLPLFLDQIKHGRPITVTDKNIIRYFMAIPEAVSLVFRAATLAKGGEVMVLDMGRPVRIYDFAKKLIELYGNGQGEIKVTGLRPGEKLYEELLADRDSTVPTEDKLVFKARVSRDQRFTEDFIADLNAKIDTIEPDQIRPLLSDLVPEFRSVR